MIACGFACVFVWLMFVEFAYLVRLWLCLWCVGYGCLLVGLLGLLGGVCLLLLFVFVFLSDLVWGFFNFVLFYDWLLCVGWLLFCW